MFVLAKGNVYLTQYVCVYCTVDFSMQYTSLCVRKCVKLCVNEKESISENESINW